MYKRQNLAQGVCDTPVPAVVEAEALAAIHAGHNIYTRLDGIARLRNAISAKQKKDYGLSYNPDGEVLVSSGATGGFHAAAVAPVSYTHLRKIRRFGL